MLNIYLQWTNAKLVLKDREREGEEKGEGGGREREKERGGNNFP